MADSIDSQPSSYSTQTSLPAPQPISEPVDSNSRYKALLETLKKALETKVSNKLTYEDFKSCFPLRCALWEDETKDLCVQFKERLQSAVVENGTAKLMEAGIQTGLQHVQDAVHRAIERADERREERVRIHGEERESERETDGDEDNQMQGDEWIITTDLTPAALTATHNLPLYDAEYDRLQAELNELDSDIDSLYKNLQTAEAQRKGGETDYQARLKELEEALVSLQALDADEMTRWMDEVIAREAISTR